VSVGRGRWNRSGRAALAGASTVIRPMETRIGALSAVRFPDRSKFGPRFVSLGKIAGARG
jgi:hypothetical protein